MAKKRLNRVIMISCTAWDSFMKPDRRFPRITARHGNIMSWPQTWDTPNRNITLPCFAAMAGRRARCTERRVNGMKRRRRKDLRIHNSILAQCIFWVKAAKKMNRLCGNGLKKPPRKATVMRQQYCNTSKYSHSPDMFPIRFGCCRIARMLSSLFLLPAAHIHSPD